MRFHRDECGQTIILVALSLPLILGFVGMATDVGSLFMDKRQMQTAADAAALAGALNITNGTWSSAAAAAGTANGFTNGTNGATVTVVNGPTWTQSKYYLQSNYIEATVSKSESTIFLAIFGFPKVTVAARAVATNQAPGNGCVFTLGTSGTDLTVQGSLDINAPDCDFNIDSQDTNGDAIAEVGKGGTINTSNVGVAGTISTGKNAYADFSPKPVGNVVPYSDPLSGDAYQFSCTTSGGCTCADSSTTPACSGNPATPLPKTCTTLALPNSGTVNLTPGCYNGFSTTGTVSLALASGVYFFNGSINLGANTSFACAGCSTLPIATGDGITMIFTSGSLNMGGTPNLDIAAPGDDGAFPGILYYQLDNTAANLTGNSNSVIAGVFYAPKASMTMQGNAGGQIYTDFVVNTLTLAGNPTFHSYAKLPGGAPTGLSSVALVE